MSFDKNYPNRKDHRKEYRKSKRFDRSCRPGGSCPYCQNNRLHSQQVRELKAEQEERDNKDVL